MRAPIRDGNGSLAKAREAFISREVRPTFKELASEFSLSESTIASACSDNGWAIVRQRGLEARLAEVGAGEVILNAMKSSRTIVAAGENVILIGFQTIARIYQQFDFSRAPSSNANVASTLSFAVANFAKSAKDLGLIGFAKELSNAGKEGNNQWNPQMLQNINVTIGKIMADKQPEVSVSGKTESADPLPEDRSVTNPKEPRRKEGDVNAKQATPTPADPSTPSDASQDPGTPPPPTPET